MSAIEAVEAAGMTATGVTEDRGTVDDIAERASVTVSGSDWRLPELQSAYQDHWTPPLLDKINRGAAEK